MLKERFQTSDSRIDALQKRLADAEFKLAAATGILSESPAPGDKLAGLKSFTERLGGIEKKLESSPSQFDESLLARLERLEARPAMKYAGVWDAADEYTEGEVVTHGGSGWVCRSATPTKDKPGASDAWQLFVKRGRDSK